MYVIELPEQDQRKIEHKLRQALTDIGLIGDELQKAVERGMASKLDDLEDTIDTSPFR